MWHRIKNIPNLTGGSFNEFIALKKPWFSKALYDINHRPRKCLAYRTAGEALEDEFE